MTETWPTEQALKRAISALNIEAGRLRMKADDWAVRGSPNVNAIRLMREDADELATVRDYLEQFVTREDVPPAMTSPMLDRGLAMDLLADAKEIRHPETSEYVISRDHMDRLMKAAGFRDLADAEQAIVDDFLKAHV